MFFISVLSLILLLVKNYDEDSKGYSLIRNKHVSANDIVYTGNVLPGASSNTYLGDLYHFNYMNHIQIHFTRIKDNTGSLLYGGKKVLFLCTNNKAQTKKELVQRVIQ